MKQIKGFCIFNPLKIGLKAPDYNNFVPIHMCIDVKFYLRRKAQMFIVGNMIGSRGCGS